MPMAEIKSRDEVIADFRKRGITVRQWARDHKARDRTVYAVLRGENKGNFGEAHRVAVLLGLKEGEI